MSSFAYRIASASGLFLLALLAGGIAVAQVPVPDYADEADESDEFGADVVMDGDRAVFSPFSHVRSDDNIFMFRRDGGRWVREAQFLQRSQMSSGSGLKGTALAGETLALGFPFVSVEGADNAGEVDVHRFDGSQWVGEGSVRSPVPTDQQRFGTGKALNGEWLAVGAPGDAATSNTTDPGRVFLYQRVGDSYEFRQEIVPEDGIGRDRYGFRVDFSGSQLLVNSPRHRPDLTTLPGAVYIYDLQGEEWAFRQKLRPGSASRIAVDGDTLVAASSSIRVYRRNAGEWALSGVDPVLPSGVTGVDSLVVSEGDPDRIAAVVYVGQTPDLNVMYWEATVEGWSEARAVGPATPFSSPLPSIALVGDRLVVGDAALSVNRLSQRGRGLSYKLNPTGPSLEQALAHGNELLGDRLGRQVAVDGDWMLAAADGRDTESEQGIVRDAGAAYIFRRTITGWEPHQTLLPPEGSTAFDVFGVRATLQGDLAVVASRASFAGVPNFGRAHVYFRNGEDWQSTCELQPPEGIASPQTPLVDMVTDGEFVVLRYGFRLFSWHVTASGCSSLGEIVVPGEVDLISMSRNAVEGRFLARGRPTFGTGVAVYPPWNVMEFDGGAWVRDSTIDTPCLGFGASFQTVTRIAFTCTDAPPPDTPNTVARLFEQVEGAWVEAHAPSIESAALVAKDIAWDGDLLLVMLGESNPFHSVHVFTPPDYATGQLLGAGEEGCVRSFFTTLAAGTGAAVIGCAEHNTAADRRSGSLRSYLHTVDTAKGLAIYAPPQLVLPPPTIDILRDSFESP